MKQFLITGGTGMVGSHLVNEIKKKRGSYYNFNS